MHLFFIAADASSGGHSRDANLDLFVRADDPQHAIRFWRKHYELERTDEPDQVFKVGARWRNGALGWGSKALPRVWTRS